jgi:hypothetical protein
MLFESNLGRRNGWRSELISRASANRNQREKRKYANAPIRHPQLSGPQIVVPRSAYKLIRCDTVIVYYWELSPFPGIEHQGMRGSLKVGSQFARCCQFKGRWQRLGANLPLGRLDKRRLSLQIPISAANAHLILQKTGKWLHCDSTDLDCCSVVLRNELATASPRLLVLLVPVQLRRGSRRTTNILSICVCLLCCCS